MTQIKLDEIQFSSFTEPYINFESLSSTITISGSVANGATANFSATLTPTRNDVIADVYATNRNTGVKMVLNAGSIHHPYQAVSTESDSHSLTFNGTSITITVTIDNFTGAGINLTSQIWDITAVLYEVSY